MSAAARSSADLNDSQTNLAELAIVLPRFDELT
jgi:hypothetical protein